MSLPGLDVLFSITFCSTGTMERCQRAALSRIYTCAVPNVIWKLFMATSIGAKGIENRHVIESIQNVQKSNHRSGKDVLHLKNDSSRLLLRAFKDSHLKMQRQSYKHSSVLFAFNFLFNDLISKHLPADLPFPVWLTLNCIMPTERQRICSPFPFSGNLFKCSRQLSVRIKP